MLGLRLLRWSFGAVCLLLGLVSAKYRWLGHYLRGSGENLLFPSHLIDWDSLTDAVVAQGDGGARGRYRLKKYELDEDQGLLEQYVGGNEMFYVLATVEFSVSLDQFELHTLVQGMDRYWWHQSPDGTWPIGLHLPGWIGRILRRFAPAAKRDAWFPFDRLGRCGVSNELWADMTEVGAAPFHTILAADMPRAEWARMLEQARARSKTRDSGGDS